ncbi:MAG: DUF3631 domain-containing protein [Phycisphaerales bacterium]|nr:DUF3631 domain-containing protein [Phycisphaerales bacterium]
MSDDLLLEWSRNGSARTVRVTAKLGTELVHADALDIARASSRTRFAKAVAEKAGVEPGEVEAQLLGIIDEANKPKAPTANAGTLDLSRIVRPELFHTPEVSGVLVPTVVIDGGKPRGRWELLLRWHTDGRRERRELLESSIELSPDLRSWFHPMPGEPEPTMKGGWSRDSRDAWVDGENASNPAEIWRRCCERFSLYLDFAPESAERTIAALALWAMFTYVFSAWPSVPYLAVGGAKNTGKTRLLDVLKSLCFRPVASSNITAACLFRTLHERGGTLLLDEAERLREGTPDAGEIRSVLLSGYKRGSPATRLEKVGDTFRRIEFDVFGPKALASIASLPDALASRCIRIPMFRAAPDSANPRRRLDDESGEWGDLRDDLHVLALEHGATWAQLAAREDVVPVSLANRDFELWQPLLALASWVEEHGATGLLRAMQAHAESVAADGRDDGTSEADETLLRIVAEAVADGRHYGLRAADVLRRAVELDGVGFAKWSERGVTAALKRYGVRTHKGTGNTGRTFAKVTLALLRRIESAYGLDLGLPVGGNVPQCTATYREPAPLGQKTG